MVNDAAALFGVMVVIFVVTFVEAFVLQACCILYNVLVGAPNKPAGPTLGGDPDSDVIGHPEAIADDWAGYEKSMKLPGVPMPTLERSMRIIFFATLVNTSGSFIILRLGYLVSRPFMQGFVRSLSILGCFLPLGVLVLGGMVAAILPTTNGKGMLISLLFHLVNILIAALLVAIVFLVTLAFGMKNPLFG